MIWVFEWKRILEVKVAPKDFDEGIAERHFWWPGWKPGRAGQQGGVPGDCSWCPGCGSESSGSQFHQNRSNWLEWLGWKSWAPISAIFPSKTTGKQRQHHEHPHVCWSFASFWRLPKFGALTIRAMYDRNQRPGEGSVESLALFGWLVLHWRSRPGLHARGCDRSSLEWAKRIRSPVGETDLYLWNPLNAFEEWIWVAPGAYGACCRQALR